MTQEIIVHILIAIALAYTARASYKRYRSFTQKKKDGCSDCALKKQCKSKEDCNQ